MAFINIDEAIKHCELKATEICGQCGKEHKQLAEWLKDYKAQQQEIERLKNELLRE